MLFNTNQYGLRGNQISWGYGIVKDQLLIFLLNVTESGDTVVMCLSDFMVLGSRQGKSSKVMQVQPQSPD